MQPSLFDLEPPAGRFALWHKLPVRGSRWRQVGTGRTHYEAVLLMSGSGEYMVIEGEGHPSQDRATRASGTPLQKAVEDVTDGQAAAVC